MLILPDGRYPGPLGEPFVARMKDWVREGGTLILVKGAAAWASEKSVGMLASKVVKKVVKTDAEAKPDPEKKAPEKAEKPPAATEPKPDGDKTEESPDPVPGAFLAPRFTTIILSPSARRQRSSRSSPPSSSSHR